MAVLVGSPGGLKGEAVTWTWRMWRRDLADADRFIAYEEASDAAVRSVTGVRHVEQ
ncbi:MAG: hypothetical protein QM714_12455 [Nocardioides sp.]|uniref:hypothetical protein n=1 Tax=Nocardioides sp. TaxID=35761 RepID=UPI0039E28193